MKITLTGMSTVGKTVLLGVTLGLLTYLLYFHRLNSLLPGYSLSEIQAYQHSLNWHTIADNISNATYYTVLWVFTAVWGHHGIGVNRIVAASMGIIVVALFYFVARLRYTFWIAFLGTLLFATSAGFLHATRLGTPQIMQFGLLAFVGGVLWYRRLSSHRVIAGYVLAILFATLLYIPGMVWFELFGLCLMFSGFRKQLQEMDWKHLSGWLGVFLATIAPLLYFGSLHPHALVDILGLPQRLALLSGTAQHALDSVLSIGIRSNGDPTLLVGHAPLLNVAELVLLATGIYMLLYVQRSKRAVFLVGSLILGLLLASVSGPVTILCIVPVLYLFIVEGISTLLGQWTTVFPRNPFAKTTGIILLCTMLFFSILYQTRIYFVAWPNNPTTRQTFTHHPPS